MDNSYLAGTYYTTQVKPPLTSLHLLFFSFLVFAYIFSFSRLFFSQWTLIYSKLESLFLRMGGCCRNHLCGVLVCTGYLSQYVSCSTISLLSTPPSPLIAILSLLLLYLTRFPPVQARLVSCRHWHVITSSPSLSLVLGLQR